MAQSILGAQKREGTGKGVARRLRQDGRIPAVLYGRELDTLHLSVDAHEAERLFHSISTENTIVSLKVVGEKEPYETLVREIQTHPFRGSLVHIDFLRIQAGVAVDVEVPVRLEGTPLGVKNSGGVLEQIIHEIEVRCIPSKIPASFDIDVTGLDVDDSVHISDLPVPEGVEILLDPEYTVCVVAIPRIVVEPTEEEDELGEGVELPEGAEPRAAGEEDAEASDGADGDEA